MSNAAQNQKLGVAVIGCGHWGPNHIRTLANHRQTRVLYCVDLDATRREAIAEQYPDVTVSGDLAAVLADAAVEAVVVATPTATHYSIASQAMAAGKHVLCEKPLARTGREAAELAQRARAAGKLLMVGHIFLFNAGILKLKELLATGSVGQVCYLHSERTNLGPIRQDVDCVWDLATHDISIYNFLLGATPLEVSARGMHYLQPDKADVAFITLTYPGNVLANIHVSWLDPKKIRQITVVGDKKMVTWDDLAPTGPIVIHDKGVVREPFYKDFGEFQLVAKDGDVVIPKLAAREPLRVQADYFVRSIQQQQLTQCGPEEGLAVVRVLEAIAVSMAGNGRPVPLGS